MRLPIAWLALAVLGLATGCQPRMSLWELVGGSDIERTIRRAETVRVWRLVENLPSNDSPRDGAEGLARLESRYRSHGEGVMLDLGQAKKLRALLLNESSYLRGQFPKGTDFASKLCRFDPIVRIRFEDARSVAEAWVCFACSEVAFTGGGKAAMPEDCSPVYREMLALVKSVLPDDPVIAKIRER